ncbi:hypothetical protein [Streptomyces sp. MST-110588]|uniref:hypothetical protein n=1 Tax=Streptomyces sp. MST-110588 TaxID=2833628 RepID=UPI001F5D5132|nr:hypothetical protein [Streptomyces sp. MST-110588]UNO40700.1 hypothetical protein KGS77_15390 [Streptomyces sp. MST-110588]
MRAFARPLLVTFTTLALAGLGSVAAQAHDGGPGAGPAKPPVGSPAGPSADEHAKLPVDGHAKLPMHEHAKLPMGHAPHKTSVVVTPARPSLGSLIYDSVNHPEKMKHSDKTVNFVHLR